MSATRAWTSNLSVAEHDVVRSVGFRPVGQVLGLSVYQVGFAGAWCTAFPGKASNEGTEANGVVKSQYEARRRALRRLTEQAKELGADGVVALRLEVQPFPDVPNTLEVRALGTAVRAEGDVRPATPFLCDLSGQDFASLLARRPGADRHRARHQRAVPARRLPDGAAGGFVRQHRGNRVQCAAPGARRRARRALRRRPHAQWRRGRRGS